MSRNSKEIRDKLFQVVISELRNPPEGCGGEFIYAYAGTLLAIAFLGNHLVEKHKDFIVTKIDHDNSWSYKTAIRLVTVGEMLFTFKDEAYFNEITYRLTNGNFKSAFYEVYTAMNFHSAGFTIDMRPLTQKRGQDFEFSVTKDGKRANIEVTTISTEIFKENTIRNRLRRKTSQLPADEPNIIVMVLPEAWGIDDAMIMQIVKVCDRYFLGTSRINAIFFVYEQHSKFEGDETRGYMSPMCVSVLSARPRSKFDMSFTQVEPWVRTQPLNFIQDDGSMNAPDRPFYRWVDEVMGR